MINFKNEHGINIFIKEEYIISIQDFKPHKKDELLKDAISMIRVAYESTITNYSTGQTTKTNTAILYSTNSANEIQEQMFINTK